MDKPNYVFKIVFFGDASVGKTSIIRCLTKEASPPSSPPPPPPAASSSSSAPKVEITKHNLKLGEQRLLLQLWDNPPKPDDKRQWKSYCKTAHAALFVFDVTNKESLSSVARYMDEAVPLLPSTCSHFLIASKIDLQTQRQVKPTVYARFAIENSMTILETSAHVGNNVESLFETMLASMVVKAQEKRPRLSSQAEPVNRHSCSDYLIMACFCCLLCLTYTCPCLCRQGPYGGKKKSRRFVYFDENDDDEEIAELPRRKSSSEMNLDDTVLITT